MKENRKLFFKIVSLCSVLSLVGCSGPSSTEKGGYSTAAMIRIAAKARKTGNPEAAINFYNRALRSEPDNAEAYLGLAEVYIDKNLLDGASEYIKKAENLGCNASRALYLKAKIALLSGNSREAEKLFLKSNSIDSMNALGAIYDERGEHKKAQSMYKKVISMDPNYIDAYNNMGLSLLLCEKYNEAIFYLENACALPETNVTYRSNLALAYGLSGNVAKAKAVYAQDFEGDALAERVAYIEDLISGKQRRSFKELH